jgi:predicted lipoprotein with Yx(FWY)xxD motif
MRPTLKTIIPALAVSLTLVACGSSSKSSSSTSAASTPAASTSTPAGSSGGGAEVVKSASNTSLGTTVLVDAQGMTLYRLSGEENGKFICTSAACVSEWHPLVAPSAGVAGASIGSLGTVKRPEGSQQVTYKGLPLYTFAGDKAPGEANGQGIKDVGVWSAISPGATTVSASKTTSSSSAPAAASSGEGSSGEGSSGSYGY